MWLSAWALPPATGTFLAFDKGNTRVTMAGGVGNSQSYVLQPGETNLIATPVLPADLVFAQLTYFLAKTTRALE